MTPVQSLYRVCARAPASSFPIHVCCPFVQEHCLRLLPCLGHCTCLPHQDEQLMDCLVQMFPRILSVLVIWSKTPVFADSEDGFACFSKMLCTYSSTALGSFNIRPVSLFCTDVNCVLYVSSPRICLFIYFCFVGHCFCMHCLVVAPLCHFSSFVIISLLLAAGPRAFVHSCSCSCHLFLSFCLGGFGKRFLCTAQFLLYHVTHLIALFFSCWQGISVLHDYPVEALP